MMKPVERVVAAFKREEGDRVPIFEIMIDPRVVQGILPGVLYPDLVDALDIDCVVSPTPSSLYGKEVVGDRDGLPVFKTEWGETRATTTEMVAFPIDHPLKTRADWEKYVIPDPDKPGRLSTLESLVSRFKGQRAIGCHLRDSFSTPSYLFGMSELLMNLYLDPGWVHEVVDACNAHFKRMVELAVDAGADFVIFGDDVGAKTNSLMSPRHYAEFFLPGLENVVRAAHGKGAFVLKHSDGNVYGLLDMFVDAGIDGFHPCDPSAGMDIVKVKREYGDRIAVAGGIDVGDPLSNWTVAELVAEVRRRIEQLAPGGGWLIASSNTIHSSVRPENYHALVTATETYGWYGCLGEPIDVAFEAAIGKVPLPGGVHLGGASDNSRPRSGSRQAG
jgi:uroporphyrinogen decarboxylase